MLTNRIRNFLAHPLRQRLTRFALSSAVAAATSAVVFPLMYVLGASTTACTVIAFFAGAVPNWMMNRRWTWKVEGNVAFGREVVAYSLISIATLVILSMATGLADHVAHGLPAHDGLRVVLVTGTYFLVLALLYGMRFFLYEHWIFSGRSRIRAAFRSRRQVWSAARANRIP